MPPILLLVYYLLLNMATLIVYVTDKFAARARRRRTRESTLLTLSVLGGAFGGLAAMLVFRHKTRKPIFWAANLLAAAGHLYLIGRLMG